VTSATGRLVPVLACFQAILQACPCRPLVASYIMKVEQRGGCSRLDPSSGGGTRTSRKTSERQNAHGHIHCQDHIKPAASSRGSHSNPERGLRLRLVHAVEADFIGVATRLRDFGCSTLVYRNQ
jgi:hypothetical protein